jgi:hypothetical protein
MPSMPPLIDQKRWILVRTLDILERTQVRIRETRTYLMSRKVWETTIDDKAYIIEVESSMLSGSGELLINGRIVDAWGPSLTSDSARRVEVTGKPAITSWTGGGTKHFEVAGKPATLKSTLFSYHLIIDGQKVK